MSYVKVLFEKLQISYMIYRCDMSIFTFKSKRSLLPCSHHVFQRTSSIGRNGKVQFQFQCQAVQKQQHDQSVVKHHPTSSIQISWYVLSNEYPKDEERSECSYHDNCRIWIFWHQHLLPYGSSDPYVISRFHVT